MATKRMSTADPLKSKRDEVYSTLLGRIPATEEFMEVKRAMQRRFLSNGKLSSVGMPENISFTIAAIQGASTQAELERVEVLVKNNAFKRLPKAELKSQLLMAAGGGGSGGRGSGSGTGAVSGAGAGTGGAEMVLKSKYDKDMETEKKKYDRVLEALKTKNEAKIEAYKLLEAEYKDTEKKLIEAKAEIKALRGKGGGGDLATALSEKDQWKRDYNDLLKASQEEKRALGETIKRLNKELTATVQGSNKGIVEDNEKMRKDLESTKEALDKCIEIKRNNQTAATRVGYLEKKLKQANESAGQLAKDLETMKQSGILNKGLLEKCEDKAKALQEKLSASTRQADESRSTQGKLEDNIRQLQGLAESKEQEAKEARQDKEERTARLKIGVLSSPPKGWVSLSSYGVPKDKEEYLKNELFKYAQSKNRQSGIVLKYDENVFLEETRVSMEMTQRGEIVYFTDPDGDDYQYTHDEYDAEDTYVDSEFSQFLVKVVPMLEKDKKRVEDTLPEGFEKFDQTIFGYGGNLYNNTADGLSNLYQYAMSEETVLILFQGLDNKWYPVRSIRQKLGKLPYYLSNGAKQSLVGRNITLKKIAVVTKDYLRFKGVKDTTFEDGQTLGGRGKRATENNTIVGTVIKAESSNGIYKILRFDKNSWLVENKRTRKKSNARYDLNYTIISHPNTGDFADSSSDDSSSDDSSSGSGGEESSEDEIEYDAPASPAKSTQLAKIQERMGQLPASGFKAGDVVRMKNQLYIVRSKDGKGVPAKKNPTGDYSMVIGGGKPKVLTSEATLVLSKEDNEEKTNSSKRKATKPKRPRGLLEQPLRVVSYEGVAGEVPALPLLRIPEPHEL